MDMQPVLLRELLHKNNIMCLKKKKDWIVSSLHYTKNTNCTWIVRCCQLIAFSSAGIISLLSFSCFKARDGVVFLFCWILAEFKVKNHSSCSHWQALEKEMHFKKKTTKRVWEYFGVNMSSVIWQNLLSDGFQYVYSTLKGCRWREIYMM